MTSERQRRQRVLSFLPKKHVRPPCPHFLDGCGGCLMQDSSYDDQLKAKELLLRDVYGRQVRVVPCPDELGYRNRMDFVAAFGKKGLRQRGKFDVVVDVKDCLLLPVRARDIWETVRTALAHVQDYDYLKHKGFLRYVVVRTSRTTNDVMLIVTTASPKDREDHRRFQEILERLYLEKGITSVHWRVNDGKTDVSIGEPFWQTGKGWIEDEIEQCRFRVYPETFFQANTVMAGALFQEAISHAEGKVLDLYAGVGALSVLAALEESVDSVVGVEINPLAVEAAKENAILNGVPREKLTFVCEDVARYLRNYGGKFDTVICDPARPGLEKAVDVLLKHAPQRIVYISCNPLSHKKDLEKLQETYELTRLGAYDLFPQTPHVEVFSVLEKR